MESDVGLEKTLKTQPQPQFSTNADPLPMDTTQEALADLQSRFDLLQGDRKGSLAIHRSKKSGLLIERV